MILPQKKFEKDKKYILPYCTKSKKKVLAQVFTKRKRPLERELNKNLLKK